MRLLPEDITEISPNLRWGVALRLLILQEIARDPQAFEAGEIGMEESWERAWQAVARKDPKAEDEALIDRTRAELRQWWQGFSEHRLFVELYRRAARRESGSGSPDSRRSPSRDEGLRLAEAMLVDLPEVPPLDLEWECAALARTAAATLLPPFGRPSRPALAYHIRHCQKSRVHFDTLNVIYEGLANQGGRIPHVLVRWRRDVAEGRRERPPLEAIPAHRPANPQQVARDIHIAFVIEVLGRIGISPQGTLISGCGIVAEVLSPMLSEDTIRRIWKACPWRKSYLPLMRKYSEPLAKRAGLHSTRY